jgi:hypothetical protein
MEKIWGKGGESEFRSDWQAEARPTKERMPPRVSRVRRRQGRRILSPQMLTSISPLFKHFQI